MKTNTYKLLVIAGFLITSTLSSQAAYYQVDKDSEAYVASYRGKASPVAPIEVVSPKIGIDYTGQTVTAQFTVIKGVPSDIKVSTDDPKLKEPILTALAQWKFTGKDGVKVILPFRIL